MQAHKRVRLDRAVAAGAAAGHNCGAYLARRAALLSRQQRQSALQAGVVDLAAALRLFRRPPWPQNLFRQLNPCGMHLSLPSACKQPTCYRVARWQGQPCSRAG